MMEPLTGGKVFSSQKWSAARPDTLRLLEQTFKTGLDSKG